MEHREGICSILVSSCCSCSSACCLRGMCLLYCLSEVSSVGGSSDAALGDKNLTIYSCDVPCFGDVFCYCCPYCRRSC